MENPFWGSFIISWLIINWKVVLVVLSWNSQKIDDKINYIESLFPFDSMLNASISLGHLALFPLIASFVAVWFIPILAREYLRKQIKNKEEDDSLKIREIKSEVSVNKEQQTLIKEVANTKKLEKSLEDNWEEEYEKLTRKYPDLINELTSILYTHEGWAGNSPEY